MTGPVVAVLDPRFSLFVADAVDRQLRRMRDDGIGPPRELLALVAALRSTVGHGGSALDQVRPDPQGGRMGPLALDYEDTAAALSISRSSLKRLVNCGDIPTVQIAGRPRVLAADLAAYLERLQSQRDDLRTAQ